MATYMERKEFSGSPNSKENLTLLNLFHTETRLNKQSLLMWLGYVQIREGPKLLPHRHQAQNDSENTTNLIYKQT